MCGLAGLININTNSNTDDALRLVTRMRDIQVHRGPDDTGIEEVGAGVYLASNRLAILDLTPAGHMPFKDGNGHSIAYNGEVYNFAQLREELEKLGHAFRSRTDTEVVLRAWIEWREECFKRFQGMFACAIYDTNNDVLILARDSLGKKPLYYMHQGGALLFASELKALSSVRTNLSPNHRRITEWSLYRNVDFGSRDTLFSDIFSLQPGHYLKIQRRQPEQPRQYFLPETLVNQALYSELDSLPLAEVTHRITQHIVHGVKTRLVADVPVGTLCSGGLDSSLITAICAKERPDLCAFNIAVKGYPQLDESVYAEKVSKSLGIKLVTYVADQNTFKSNLARAIYHSDQPLTHPNSVFFMKVSELARQHGVLVLLSGEGADELFGGYVHRYRRYAHIKTMEKWLQYLPTRLRRAIAVLGYTSESVPITEFSDYEGLLGHATMFLDRFTRLELRERSAGAYRFIKNDSDRAVLGAMLADITNFLTPLLRRLDRMTMAASVECRAPFLDRQLMNTMVNLPLGLRLKGGTDKWLLKSIAAQYLPRDIVYRRKLGFPLPIADYIEPFSKPEFFKSGFCVEVLGMNPRGLALVIENWRTNVNGFFNLLALEIWGRMFFLGQSSEDITDRIHFS